MMHGWTPNFASGEGSPALGDHIIGQRGALPTS
jgi:hypothetical protein